MYTYSYSFCLYYCKDYCHAIAVSSSSSSNKYFRNMDFVPWSRERFGGFPILSTDEKHRHQLILFSLCPMGHLTTTNVLERLAEDCDM